MAEKRKLLPSAPDGPRMPLKLVPEGPPGNPLEGGVDAILAALGVKEQRPGDPWTGAGAAASIIPLGKLIKMLSGASKGDAILRRAPKTDSGVYTMEELEELKKRLPAEFTAVGSEPPYVRPTHKDPREAVYEKVKRNKGRAPK